MAAFLYGAGSDGLPTIIPVKAIGAVWFLWALFWGSVIFRVTLTFSLCWRGIALLSLFALGVWSSRYIWLPMSIQSGLLVPFYMFIGYVIKQKAAIIQRTKKCILNIILALSFAMWQYFIITFNGFYLVTANIGRGTIDVIGSICGCCCITYAIWKVTGKTSVNKEIAIDSKRKSVKQQTKCIINKQIRWLSIAGRYSIIILCVHLVEMNCIPWRELSERIAIQVSIPNIAILLVFGVIKMLLIVILFMLCIRSKKLCWLFGLPEYGNEKTI